MNTDPSLFTTLEHTRRAPVTHRAHVFPGSQPQPQADGEQRRAVQRL